MLPGSITYMSLFKSNRFIQTHCRPTNLFNRRFDKNYAPAHQKAIGWRGRPLCTHLGQYQTQSCRVVSRICSYPIVDALQHAIAIESLPGFPKCLDAIAQHLLYAFLPSYIVCKLFLDRMSLMKDPRSVRDSETTWPILSSVKLRELSFT